MADTIPSEEESLKLIMLMAAAAWRNDLSKQDIEKWLRNFTGEVFAVPYERQLALFLLSNFVYYNIDEVRHLCRTVFRSYLHRSLSDQAERHEKSADIELHSLLYKTVFCPLGKPGESGSQVLYYFRQENNISVQHISEPDRLPAFAERAAFLDDATISGAQALDYLKPYRFEKTRAFLLTFLSTLEAVEVLQKAGITVVSCITLDERSRSFSRDATLFRDFGDSYEDCEKFATVYGEKSLLEDVTVCEPLGFKNGGYSFGFFYNTPDNSLPIFWANNRSWSPIMKRYQKLKVEVYRDYGKFI